MHSYKFIAICLWIGVVGSGPAKAVDTPQSSSSLWQSISLPHRALCIAGGSNTLWVAGVGELIEKSDDGGKTWQVKHEKSDGQILLTIGVLDEKTIYASGTNGIMLWSSDGGATWKSWNSGTQRVVELTFVDPLNGIRRLHSGVELTGDGGVHWTNVSIMQTDESVSPYSEVLGAAALDASHLALLLHKPEGENIFLSTQDGGKTWRPLHIDDTYAQQLFAHNGRYWAFGMEILERQKRGGYSAPLVLSSADGMQWVHGAKSPNEFDSCTSQGCVLYDGVVVDLYGEKPRYTVFPGDGVLTHKWAFNKDTICTIGASLLCAAAKGSEILPPRPERNVSVSLTNGDVMINSPGDCVYCLLSPFPLNREFLKQVPVTVTQGAKEPRRMLFPGLQANIKISYVVRSDGTVDHMEVEGAPVKEIESRLATDFQNWVFEPPVAASQSNKREINLLVHCVAFPMSEQANCSSIIPTEKSSTLPN